MRIAFSADLGYASVDREVADAVERAARAFETLGAHVEAVDPGSTTHVRPSTLYGRPARPARVRISVLNHRRGSIRALPLRSPSEAGSPSSTILPSSSGATTSADGSSLFLADWDVLLTPTLPIQAFGAGRDVPEDSGLDGWSSWTPFTYPFNLTQQPAATVPCGFTRSGLPIGLQIVGPRHGDALVLRIARAYERHIRNPR